ncbi:MAG: glutamyl-tRNA reductase [Clostridiales bacterium]|nr:MAG: glutamyl-tRNA reductase [Clostridiales bacterium]
MNLLVVGVNYKRTPIEIREKLSFTDDDQKKNALAYINELNGVEGCVVLSTCNRMEVYLHTKNEEYDIDQIESALCTLKDIDIDSIKKYLYFYQGIDVVQHLFRVTSGLDSMILGEDEILGQVKAAFELSLEENTSDSVINGLFKEAVTAAKKIKTVTEISNKPVSVGSHAVLAIEGALGKDLSGKTAMVVGAGQIGKVFLANIKDRGLKNIYVTIRGYGRKNRRELSGLKSDLINFKDRYDYMDECDIVVSATTSPHYTITKSPLEDYIKAKKERVFVDLAVPRDIDKRIEEIDGIHYFNIDYLKKQVDENYNSRKQEAIKASDIIDEYVVGYEKWYYFRQMLPFVNNIKSFSDKLVKNRADDLSKRVKGLSQNDEEKIQYAIKKTADDIINRIIYGAKEIEDKEHMQVYFQCLSDVINQD